MFPHSTEIPDNIISQYESKKGLADDLTEGKFSFPIIHGIQSDNKNRLLLSELDIFLDASTSLMCS
jgi:hypothetical protein